MMQPKMPSRSHEEDDNFALHQLPVRNERSGASGRPKKQKKSTRNTEVRVSKHENASLQDDPSLRKNLKKLKKTKSSNNPTKKKVQNIVPISPSKPVVQEGNSCSNIRTKGKRPDRDGIQSDRHVAHAHVTPWKSTGMFRTTATADTVIVSPPIEKHLNGLTESDNNEDCFVDELDSSSEADEQSSSMYHMPYSLSRSPWGDVQEAADRNAIVTDQDSGIWSVQTPSNNSCREEAPTPKTTNRNADPRLEEAPTNRDVVIETQTPKASKRDSEWQQREVVPTPKLSSRDIECPRRCVEEGMHREREYERSRRVLVGSPSMRYEIPASSSSSFSYDHGNLSEDGREEWRKSRTLETIILSKPTKTETGKKKSKFHDEENPPVTQRTMSTSSSTSRSSSPPSSHTIKIENKGSGGYGGCTCMSWIKCVSLLLLLGAMTYFIYHWTQIPKLNEQIDRLETEVSRLTGQVDRLAEENNRYATLNDELNSTVQDLNDVKDDLNTTSLRLEVVNEALNATNKEFQVRIEDLTEQNQRYQELNEYLSSTVSELEMHVDEFQSSIAVLILQNAALSNQTSALEDITGNLDDIAQDQSTIVQALEVVFGIMVGENDRLEHLNVELEMIVGFLNETSLGIGESLEDVTDFLAEQISTSRLLLLTNIETSFQSRVANWDCDYRDVYRERPFGIDFDLQIPPKEIPGIVAYVENRILSDLCLHGADFHNYLTIQYGDDLTSNRLVTGVTNYVSAALDWYFDNNIGKDDEESRHRRTAVGVSQEEWAAAGYQCENLNDSFLFPIGTIIWG